MRRIAGIAMAAGAAALAAGCGSSSSHRVSSNAAAPAVGTSTTPVAAMEAGASAGGTCRSQQQPGIDASFGIRRSPAAAQALIEQAARVGFQNLRVQKRGCKKYAAVLIGLSSMRQARDFRREAAGAGFHVLIECRSGPVRGGIAVVFGHRSSHRTAVILMRAATAKGFQNLQVQQDRCGDWEVDLYGADTAKQRAQLRREAAAAGYHVTFEPG